MVAVVVCCYNFVGGEVQDLDPLVQDADVQEGVGRAVRWGVGRDDSGTVSNGCCVGFPLSELCSFSVCGSVSPGGVS